MIVNRPVTLYFQPLALEAKFEKCLKLQLAIFRLSPEEAKGGKRAVKMDKTEPAKFTDPHEKITFARTLSLLTTLPYHSLTMAYEPKEVDFEMALEIDGKKERMGRKLNLKELLNAKSRTFKFTQEDPAIVLSYRAEVKLEDEKGQPEAKKIEQPKKSPKVLRFKEEGENAKENMKAARPEVQPVRAERADKGRHKTVFFQPSQPQAKIADSHSAESERVLKKYKSLNKNLSSSEQQGKEDKAAAFQLETREKERYAKLESMCAAAEKTAQELEKRLKEKDARIAELTLRNQELQQRMQGELKTLKREKEELKREKEELKREQSAKSGQQSQVVAQLRQQIRCYQCEVEKYRKSALTLQESSKHIAAGNEQEVKALKERILSLQKLGLQSSRESDFYEQSLRSKDEIIGDLKARIYSLDKEGAELHLKLKALEARIANNKQEYQFELEQLQSRIQEMKEENKNFKIATLKDIKDDSATDYKRKAEALEKQLEKKEELLRRMGELKKEGEQERSSEAAALRQEVAALKERLQSKESRESRSECGDIEMKIQLQRLKKEVECARKSEKALLIEKGRLEAGNRALQDDIVRSKCAIANILNAVQETGNEKLITEVYGLTE